MVRTTTPFYETVDADELRRLHHEQGMTLEELVEYYDGPSRNTVRRAFDKNDITFYPQHILDVLTDGDEEATAD